MSHIFLKRTLKINRTDIRVFQKFINSEMYLSKNNWINLFSLRTIQSQLRRALELNS